MNNRVCGVCAVKAVLSNSKTHFVDDASLFVLFGGFLGRRRARENVLEFLHFSTSPPNAIYHEHPTIREISQQQQQQQRQEKFVLAARLNCLDYYVHVVALSHIASDYDLSESCLLSLAHSLVHSFVTHSH